MKALIWILVILALAVALIMAARFTTGYVVLVLPPYRVEFSLNLLIFLDLAVFFLAYGLIRLGAGTLDLPSRIHAYRQKRQQDKIRSMLDECFFAFAAGQYPQAEKLASTLLDQDDVAGIAALVAARSAHALGSTARRDAYLAQVGKSCSDYPQAGMSA